MYSNPNIIDKNFVQQTGHRPLGLWYDSKENFCLLFNDTNAETNYLVNFTYTTKKNSYKILKITTASELDKFTFKYGRFDLKSKVLPITIDWYLVSQDYAGIQIFPKIKERSGLIIDKSVIRKYQKHGFDLEKKFSWYSTWRTATGCVWRNEAIENIEVITKKPVTKTIHN